MGPREKNLRENAALCFPPDGAGYFTDPLALAELERRQMLDALEEALNGWGWLATQTGRRDGCVYVIARLRKLLSDADE